jgi:ABC-type phosphate/phosphonate transport system permease subunit
MVRIGKKWKKAVKRRIFDAEQPPKNVSRNMATASVLTAAWWDMTESRINTELSKSRDIRFAKRLRGALSRERETHGSNATILVPMIQTWRMSILGSLQSLPEAEEIISSSGPSEISEGEE